MIAGGDQVLNKTITMEDLRILDVCRDIELLNEQLYRYFSDLFLENGELAMLWKKTANEEANHAQQFELAIRHKNEMLESVSLNACSADTAFKYVCTLLEIVKSSPPSVTESLQLAVKLEERLTRLHLECIASFTEESHKKLFRAMMAQDNYHIETILEAQKKYSKTMH